MAVLAGLAVGWFARAGAAAKAEAQAAELAPLRAQLADVIVARDTALRDLAVEHAAMGERAHAFEARLTELREAKEVLAAQFNEVGTKLLADAQRQFLERADQRFAQAGEKNDAQLKALLTPVETTLKRYEEGLAKVEKDRVGSYEALKEAVASLAQGNDIVRKETARLTNVLRSSPKHRGRWGEQQLRTILESAGLAENVDFELETSISDGERQLRPDCVIKLPGGRCIVIDVKCPLTAFEQAFDEEDEGRRGELLLAHAAAMRSYAMDLGRKSYWKQFDLSPDFVIMFIPGEHFLSAAAERAPDLIEQAFRGGVIIASTINMLALAKVMAGMWRQEGLAKQAEEVGRLGKDLYARLQTMGRHVEKLGRNLNQATGAYNDFVGSLESQVMTQAKRFEALSVETGGKTIEPLPMIETAVRPLAKLSTADRPDYREAAD
ncbi:DNA recombination protein RmuC [Sphingomonas sp. ASY06-1R]|uniref:DNA recombination protein RmuC n=1 Tax=Sphingomonas sp. ASY06-1R TaxID=3445771 RepID=UPI003FA1B038